MFMTMTKEITTLLERVMRKTMMIKMIKMTLMTTVICLHQKLASFIGMTSLMNQESLNHIKMLMTIRLPLLHH